MIILITGVSGFIGKALSQHLIAQEYRVVGSGRGSLAPPGFVGEYRQLDLLDPINCSQVLKDIDGVVHCAGKAGTWGPYKEYFLANVIATENLLLASKQRTVSRFINISSPSIYTDYKDQWDLKEDFLPAKFSNAYAQTKYQAECLVNQAHGKELLTLSLRPRGVIGAGDRNWFPRVIEMRQNQNLVQVGDGNNKAEFTSVSNLLQLIQNCLSVSPQCFGEVYNVTNGDPVNLWKFIEQGLLKVGLDGKRKKMPLSVLMPLARANAFFQKTLKIKTEPRILPIKLAVAAYSMTMNIEKAKKKLNYRPQVSNDQAMDEFARWWQK